MATQAADTQGPHCFSLQNERKRPNRAHCETLLSSLPDDGSEWWPEDGSKGCHASDCGDGTCGDILRNFLWIILAGGFVGFINLFGGLLLCVTLVGAPAGYEMIRGVPDVCCPFGKRWKVKPNPHMCCKPHCKFSILTPKITIFISSISSLNPSNDFLTLNFFPSEI